MSNVLYVLVGLLLGINAGFVLGVVFHRTAVDREERLKLHVSTEVNAIRGFFVSEMESLKREIVGDAEHVRQGMKDVIKSI